MSSGCGDVLTLEDLKTAKKHQVFEAEVITGKSGGVASGTDIDYATNQVTGQTQKTMPAILRDIGFTPVSWDFSTGGTLGVGDRDKAVYDPVSKTWYSYTGTLPVVVPAGFNPVGNADWKPQTDPNLRADLADTANTALGDALIGVKQPGAGVSRTLHDKLSDYISVTDFGVSTTGDATSSFQEALNNAGNLYVPEGTYTVSAPLNVKSGTKLFGPGTIVSTDQTDSVLKIVDVSNVVIDGPSVLRSLGSSPGGSALSSNIMISNSQFVTVKNTVTKISSIGTCILVTSGSKDVNISGNYCTTDGTYDASVLQTESTVASPNAIFVADSSRDILVTANTCENIGHGVMIQNVAGTSPIYNVTVTNNNIRKCSSYGIISYRLSDTVYNVNISNNTIEDIYGTYYNAATPATPYTHGSGIYGQNVYRHVIKGNLIRNVCVNTNNFGTLSPAAIGFGSVSNFEISDNVISLSASNGILLDGVLSVISGNVIKEISRAAVRTRTSEHVKIVNNSIDCSSSGTQGVLAEASASWHKYLDISGNTINGSNAAIDLQSTQNSRVSGNTIQSQTGANSAAISVGGTGYDVIIEGNTVTVNGGYGIRPTITAVVINNRIKGATTGQSIAAQPGSFYNDNFSDTAGTGSVFVEQALPSANALTLLYQGPIMRVNITDATNALQGVTSVPVGATVIVRVPSGATIQNMGGTVTNKFRFADGAAKTTSRTQLFTFVNTFSGILDCVSIF